MGIDLVYLGVLVGILMSVGTITPPVGIAMFVVSKNTRYTHRAIHKDHASMVSAYYRVPADFDIYTSDRDHFAAAYFTDQQCEATCKIRNKESVMILQGITWDHERGILPLLAVSEEYHRIYPDIEIHWKKRSLKDFEDFPIEKLVKDYDLIMVDHPFMSEARKEKLLLPLQELLSAKCMADLKRENIAQTYDSYWVDSDLMALPVDAATQVSAYRPDYFAEKGLSAPRSFEEIFKLAASLEAGKAIGACMNPTHIFSTYMSLSAQQLGKDYFDRERGIDENVGVFFRQNVSIGSKT